MNLIAIRIEGLEELTKAVQALASAHCGVLEGKAPTVATQPLQATQTTQNLPVSMVPQQAVPQMPVSQPVPVQVTPVAAIPGAPSPAPAPVPVQVPTTAAPQQYSFDQLAVALSNLCANMNKQTEVHALLNQFGVNALFDLPKERYGEFATALRGIGGVI
ncbi:MAG: hypothetical protein ACI4EX_01700 [Lachnospiraceae bacterium]